MQWIKRIFSLRNLLIIFSIVSSGSLLLAYLSPYINPETIPVLPFFGLSYYVIIACHALLTLLWLFYRSKWTYVMLALILIGGTLHFRMFAFGSDAELKNQASIHIMSYNVRLLDLYNPIKGEGIKTRNKIFEYLKEVDPDIVCFQEFYQQDPPTLFTTRDSIYQFMSFVDHHERYVYKRFGRQNFGVILFSKYPIIQKGVVNFPNQQTSQNFCIYADIVKQDTFRIYNVHLQSVHLQQDDYALFDDPEKSHASDVQSSNLFKLYKKIQEAYPVRAEQAKSILEHAKDSPYPVIIVGDMNVTPLSYTYNQFNARYIDAFRNCGFGMGSTYAGKIPAGRIDYIFHDNSLESRDFTIQNEKLSDHFAIDCEVFVKENE